MWNPVGVHILRVGAGIARRFDTVALNYSLHTPTNGEEWLIEQLPRHDRITVVDVGFNRGNFTASILDARPKTARVIAFDPWRPAGAACESRFPNDSRVVFVPSALSSAPGVATFHDYDSGCNSLAARVDAGPEQSAYEVPVETLDEWCAVNDVSHITFLKIDAEGFDLAVMEGARDLLAAGKIDLIMFEYSTGWIGARRFLQDVDVFLKALPYSMNRLWNGFISPFQYTVGDEAFSLRTCMYVVTSDRAAWVQAIPRRRMI